MTCSVRYYRPGRHAAGLVIIANESEFAAYKARLEASGYVVAGGGSSTAHASAHRDDRRKRPIFPELGEA